MNSLVPTLLRQFFWSALWLTHSPVWWLSALLRTLSASSSTPAEQYHRPLLDRPFELQSEGFGDVEVHLDDVRPRRHIMFNGPLIFIGDYGGHPSQYRDKLHAIRGARGARPAAGLTGRDGEAQHATS